MENCKYLIPLITLPPMMEQKAFNEIEGEISSRYQVLVTVGKTNWGSITNKVQILLCLFFAS